MTSRIDNLKTEEFLRRRKLRLQQVREQSKDIAKTIRHRAKVEKLRHLDDIDAKKEKEYFDCQEKLVKHLEFLYRKGLKNVGTSHKNALEINQQVDSAQKIDLSKLRGREAVAELRKKKQEKLDEQKKLLDRKLQARDAANEISREKSTTLTKNLKPTFATSEELHSNSIISDICSKNRNQDPEKDNIDKAKNDMGTQWESAELLNEWEPHVPELLLPKEDSVKDSVNENVDKIDQNKKVNLFAVSDEMPTSLRGGITGVINEAAPTKSSLTLVSEYLQNRPLRLRQNEPNSSKKADDLQSIKQTILRTRATRTDGSREKSSQSTELNTGLTRKKSISIYNHNTRNIQNMPWSDERLVSRDNKAEEDAYAQALKESTLQNTLEKEQLNKEQKEMRTKVAVTKQNVDKEYRDTLAFLNSLTRDKSDKSDKPLKIAYMDDQQQQMQNGRYQRKLQQEFKKIEKECYKRNCKHSKRRPTIFGENKSNPTSPIRNEATGKEFEYSWMPVPESDNSLAVHTIPNAKHKSGNTVKFSKPDSYHEYRSRHKHTPPTKDVSGERQTKRFVEAVIVQQNSDDSDVNGSSLASETSSAENLSLKKHKNKAKDDSLLKDADRIIIYKILDSRKEKKSKENKTATLNKVAVSNDSETNNGYDRVKEPDKNKTQETKRYEKPTDPLKKGVSFEQLQEGVYQAVSNNGDNVNSLYFTESQQQGDDENQREKLNKTEPCCKDVQVDGGDNTRIIKQTSSCKCGSKSRKHENSNVPQPSAPTSNTSFTTAFNDNTNNRLNDDLLKLIERAQESSKFYVGASGFLKDDNYEVVIQLRKKDIEKQTSSLTNPTKSLETETQEIGKDMSENAFSGTKENLSPTPSMEKATNVEVDSTIFNNVLTIHKQQTETEKSEEPKQNSQLNNVSEKQTHTSFQDSYAIPAHVPKLDPISRPATSTYTQTSFNSSLPRPAFMHMSSSTSTAYMSPPELILPKFLKHNNIITNDEVYESENTMNQLDSNYIVINDENCKECSKCMSSVSERYNLKTPPNTARSCNRDKSTFEYVGPKKTKCKCHKCRCRSDTNIRHKSHTNKCRSMLKTRSSRHLPSDNCNPTLKRFIKNKIISTCSNTKGNRSKLHPTVKDYVNKLLSLNSEGLKAVEIINQDCSAVATPGSSIINLPCNVNNDKSTAQNKISLEQLKNVLKQQILKDDLMVKNKINLMNKESQTEKYKVIQLKLPKKKSVHKVKSLNISKNVLKKKKPCNSYIPAQSLKKPLTPVNSISAREDKKFADTIKKKVYTSKGLTPKTYDNSEYKNSTSSDVMDVTDTEPYNVTRKNTKRFINRPAKSTTHTKLQRNKNFNLPLNKATRTSFSSDSDVTGILLRNLRTSTRTVLPIHISTQTNDIIDAEIDFMKKAEDKLQNMEKIADLTEKCTKRLSNLAKVLEEVRKNKSLVYSQISTSDSMPESETKSNKNEPAIEISEPMSEPIILTQDREIFNKLTTLGMTEKLDDNDAKVSAELSTILKDIPKPEIITTRLNTPLSNLIDDDSDQSTNMFRENIKSRGKPPPALSRKHLKHGQEIYIIPHELSTVIEVDSPMSTKLRSHTSRQESQLEIVDKSNTNPFEKLKKLAVDNENPDLLQSNNNLSRRFSKVSSTDSSDDSKMRMMDLKKFNDIMLKPFISLREYAKQCNIGLDEGSNLEDANKDEPINDDLSSLHSDGSLPDVIAELLKRKIISEPFKYDTGSNINSTTFSSESTLSILASSKAKKERKKSGIFLKDKENIADSESLSVSSNPDLENAFQKLGMGWASSTLKKTKERLALSSSSNTSSSSMTQFKIKNFSLDIPNLATDSASSLLDAPNKRDRKNSLPARYIKEVPRNAVQQQTSLTNSMTVKEFLTNELAKKITFNNKSSRRDAEEEFISLYETKMPEEMKHASKGSAEDQLSVASVNNNRARTSTPVQIFKSQAYQSSSTSNTSNGFFSNVDDLSSVKVTSTSIRNHSTSDKDDLTIPNYSLKTKKGLSDKSKSD